MTARRRLWLLATAGARSTALPCAHLSSCRHCEAGLSRILTPSTRPPTCPPARPPAAHLHCREIRKAWEDNVGPVLAFGRPALERLSFGDKPMTVAGVKVLPHYSQQDSSRMESLGGWVGGWAGGRAPYPLLPGTPATVSGNAICAGRKQVLLPLHVHSCSCLPACTAAAAVLLLDLRWAGRPEVVIKLGGLPAEAMTYTEASCHLRVELSGLTDEVSTLQLGRVGCGCRPCGCRLREPCYVWRQSSPVMPPGSSIVAQPLPAPPTPPPLQLPFIGGLRICFANLPKPQVEFDLK